MYITNHSVKKSIPERLFLKSDGIQNVSSKYWSSARRASRNCSKGLEETLLGGVVNKSDNVDFFPFLLDDHLSGSNIFLFLFYKDGRIYRVCAG